MKVLKPGRPQSAWNKKYACADCRASLLVTKDDIFRGERSIMGREFEHFPAFECPLCRAHTKVKEKDCPLSTGALPTYEQWKAKQPRPGLPQEVTAADMRSLAADLAAHEPEVEDSDLTTDEARDHWLGLFNGYALHIARRVIRRLGATRPGVDPDPDEIIKKELS